MTLQQLQTGYERLLLKVYDEAFIEQRYSGFKAQLRQAIRRRKQV